MTPLTALNDYDRTSQDAPRVLWRMQGPTRVVSATLLRRRGGGTELKIFFEPEATGDVLGRHFEERAYRVRRLEKRAARLRDALVEQGWIPLDVPDAGPSRRTGRWLKLAAAAGLGAFALARWSRREKS